MAKIIEWSEEQQKMWEEWVTGKPESVQELCRRLPPYNSYLLKSTNHRVTIYSYAEDGTVTVNVTGEYNALMFERQVFGIHPDELEECDLPVDNETLGVILTKESDVDNYLKYLRDGEK